MDCIFLCVAVVYIHTGVAGTFLFPRELLGRYLPAERESFTGRSVRSVAPTNLSVSTSILKEMMFRLSCSGNR